MLDNYTQVLNWQNMKCEAKDCIYLVYYLVLLHKQFFFCKERWLNILFYPSSQFLDASILFFAVV